MPNLNTQILSALPVLLPSLQEQKSIAHILSTLDDKIELNRKTNETLEAMAKSIFKSWFVDFDPVRAKAEGRPTGLSAEISDLFPDSFEDSELGEIPSGWSISNLDDFIHLDSGLPYKGLLKGTGEAHLLTMGCADRALRFKSDGVHSYPSSIPARHLVNPGDIVICSHDLTQAREQLGAPFVVPDNFSGRIAAAATNTFIVRQKSPSTTEYLYQIFRSNGFREQMIASAKGSVILHISKESVLYYSFASPGSDRLISAYQSATDGMTQKIQEIGKGIYTLATIRDALLPKLISGEIRIPDAEKMLEEVGV
jgi:type I restriction enzyme S subunit